MRNHFHMTNDRREVLWPDDVSEHDLYRFAWKNPGKPFQKNGITIFVRDNNKSTENLQQILNANNVLLRDPTIRGRSVLDIQACNRFIGEELDRRARAPDDWQGSVGYNSWLLNPSFTEWECDDKRECDEIQRVDQQQIETRESAR